ncbi:hypothetical protein BROUX41_005651 [Berkeleyomyces rouxiae]|uniref:uncharacterized protein n=1 Tax=Berkeleyomyces rouxiae TaxID=2035830 RepID=UPI003B78EAC1
MSNSDFTLSGCPAPPSASLSAQDSLKGSIVIPSLYSSEANNSNDHDDDDDGAALPFPEALPRSDFLVDDFDPATFLSALRERHQTLEDLRADLRERSTAINTELLELVNSNYTAFLSLGNDLRGGDDKVSDVQMSLLGFRRALEDMKGNVRGRAAKVEKLNNELKTVRDDMEIGRKMVEVDDLLSDLEARLCVDSLPQSSLKTPTLAKAVQPSTPVPAIDAGWFSDSESDDAEDFTNIGGNNGILGVGIGTSPAKLAALVTSLQQVEKLFTELGRDTPFVVKVDERRLRCRNTIMLDLSNAMKEAKQAGPRAQGRLLSYMGLYRTLGASAEAVKILKAK